MFAPPFLNKPLTYQARVLPCAAGPNSLGTEGLATAVATDAEAGQRRTTRVKVGTFLEAFNGDAVKAKRAASYTSKRRGAKRKHEGEDACPLLYNRIDQLPVGANIVFYQVVTRHIGSNNHYNGKGAVKEACQLLLSRDRGLQFSPAVKAALLDATKRSRTDFWKHIWYRLQRVARLQGATTGRQTVVSGDEPMPPPDLEDMAHGVLEDLCDIAEHYSCWEDKLDALASRVVSDDELLSPEEAELFNTKKQCLPSDWARMRFAKEKMHRLQSTVCALIMALEDGSPSREALLAVYTELRAAITVDLGFGPTLAQDCQTLLSECQLVVKSMPL